MQVFHTTLRATLIACLLLLALPGCGSKSGTGSSGSSTTGTSAAPREVESGQISDEEATAFAKQLETDVSEGRTQEMEAVIDWTFLIGTATSGLDVPDKFRSDFQRGVTSNSQFSKQIGQAVATGGTYKFLRVHDVDGQKRAFFRLALPEGGGINFHDLVLRKTADNKVVIADIYVFLSGEMLSMTLRRAFIPAAAHESRNLLQKLSGKESDFVKHLPQLQQISQNLDSGKNQAALNVYYELPESLQKDKTLLLFRIRASQAVNNVEYIKALEAFRRQYPDDSCVDFLSIDAHVLNGDFDKALKCVERVNEAVEGDAALLQMKAQLYLESGDLQSARKSATEALKLEPDHVDSHWILVALALQQKDHAETARLLTKIERDFGLEIDNVNGVPEYADFVRSPEYREWLDSKQSQ